MTTDLLTPETVVAPPGRAVIRTAAACEWRLVRRDPACWGALVLLAACVAFATWNGRARVAGRARAVAEAREDEARRLKSLTTLLGKIERGEVPPPDAPYRDPRNAIYVGRGQGAAVAYLPDAPLAVAATGLSDLEPQVLKVSAGSKDTFLFVDEIENPARLLGGGFDLAFVIVHGIPLLILAACYDLLSAERERGTLALTLASSAPLWTVLLGKLLVRAGIIALAGLVLVGAGVAAGWSRADLVAGLPALGGLGLALVIWAAFWAGVCLFVNALGRDSAFNAAATVAAWAGLIVAGPAALAAVAEALHPAPARSELVLAVREAAVDADRDRDAAEARVRDEHPDGPPPADDRTRRTLDVTVAADARADAVLAAQEALIDRQRRLADRLAYLMPACLIQDAIQELSGNGRTRRDDYLRRVADFHGRFRAAFVAKAKAGEALTVADYARFPRFDVDPVRVAIRPEGAARIAAALAVVAAMAAALIVVAARRLDAPA